MSKTSKEVHEISLAKLCGIVWNEPRYYLFTHCTFYTAHKNLIFCI